VIALVAGLFALSGLAALVYQVAWQRILVLQTGVGVESVALIVGAFMAGLGAGSHLGGLWSRRLTRRAALTAFAGVELGIALFAAFSSRLYYDGLYVHGAALAARPALAAAAQFAALLPPTLLMGMSLPLLARALVDDVARAGRTLGVLYGVNVLGAALGALLAPWVLIRQLGIPGAVLAAACGNALAGLGALALRGRVRDEREGAAAPRPAAAAGPVETHPLALWLTLYALSGFCALALEIVWFRMVDVAVKSTAFTFGTVLSVYLFGSAAGSLLGAFGVARLRRPLPAFLLCQCLLLLASAGAVLALVSLPADAPVYRWFHDYWRELEGFRLGRATSAHTVARLYVLLPLALYGLPTMLMGLSFPILQRAVQDEPRSSGFKVGLLQAANIAGCVAGSLLVGLGTLTWLGTAGTLRVLVALGLVFAALGLRQRGGAWPFALVGALLVAALLALPDERGLWLRLHGAGGPTGPKTLLQEDATSVVALVQEPAGDWHLTVNGVWNSALPFGGIHARLGALPAVLHPAPRDVVVIGLGSGNTAWAAGCRPETERLRVYEISAPQLDLLERLAAGDDAPPRLRRFLRDPRLDVRVADGRHALRREPDAWDLIELDALRPYAAGAGNLYSLEFFRSCARRLKPGGVMCAWSPTPRTAATFAQAFAHVVAFEDERVLVGGNDEIPLDVAAWTARLHDRRVFAYLGAEVARDVGERLKSARPLERRPVPARGLNRDLYPRDEFTSPE
jgi:SAM-dependent methyltransferase